MARDPELSIKVKVDPQIDGEKLKNDIQDQVDNVKKLPKVNVDVNVGDFSKSLSDHMKTELKEVNKKVGYYLSTMTQNVDELNKVTNNLFSDVNFSNRIQKQFDDVYIQFDQFKKQLEDTKEVMSSIFNDTDFLSVNDFEKSLSNVQKEIETLYGKAFKIDKDHFKTDDFEKTFHNVISKISPDLEKITKAINNISGLSESNSDILKRLGMSEDDFMDATENIGALGDSLSELIEFSKNADFSDKGIKSFFLSIGRTASEMEGLFKSALSDVNELELSVGSKYKAIEEARKKAVDARKENLSGGFDKEKLNEMSQAYLKAMGVLVNQQRILNTTKRSTVNLEDDLLTKTKEVSTTIGEEVINLKSLFDEVSKSDIGKQLPAVSEYMKSKAELEASKNIESAKSLSLNINSSSAKEYEAALKGIKDRINELGKEGAFDGLNNNIDENERAFINAKEYIKDYASALDEVKSKGRDTRLPQQKTTGLNVSNIENYSQKVTAIKNDLYALKDTVFPAIYSDINRTYGHLFDDSIINAQSYIDKLNELPAAASSKAPTKTQHSKKVETIDSTNIKNYAALLNGIQGAMNDMKTTIVPGFDKVLSENGKKIADIGGSLVNYVAVLKRGLTAVDQSEKNMADKTAVKPSVVPTKNNAPVKKPTVKKTQDAKVTIDSNEVVVTGGPVDIPGKVELKDKDIKRPDPLNINGALKIKASDIKIDDVEISKKKFDINGNLILKNAEIVDAVKEATKEATRKAQPKQSTAKTKNGLIDRDFERKSKELLTSLASIMKGKARVQNSLTTHTRKGQSEAAAEDSYYLSKLSRRERTTKGKLTKLYKGRGGRSAWQNSSIYHSATEDSEHIRNSRVAENSDKDKVAEEEKYIAALRQRSKIYKELAAARRKYGDDSEYVKFSQKELQNTLDIISQFESKVGSQYLQAMPERRKVFAENMSNFRKDRDDIRHKNTQIAAKDQQKAIVATNKSAEKERIASEKEFLENLAKVPKLWADAEKARKKYGDNSAEAKQAEYLRDKNQSSINDFKSNYTGSLSDIPGYDDQVKENNFAIAAYQSGMTCEANAEQQKQHDAVQAAFQKRRDEAAKQAEAAQKAVEKSSIDMVNRVAKSIEESKKIYLDAEKEIIKRQAELLTTEDSATKQDIIDKISDAKNLKKTAGARINSYSGDYTGLVQNAWDDINSEKKSYKIDQSLANEQKSNKEIAATFDEIIGKYSKLDKLEQRRSKLFKPEDVQQLQDVDEAIVKLTDDITTLEIKALDSGIDLHANSDYSNKVAESSKISKESAVTFTNNKRTYDVNAAKESYLTNYKDWLQNMDYIDRIDPNSINAQELISRYQKRADENKQAIDAARQILSINNDISKDAWDEIQRWKDSLSITNAEKAAKEAQKATDKKDSDDAAFFTKLQTAVNRKIKAYDDFMKAEPGTKDWVSKSGKNSIADNNLLDLQNQATATGLSSDQRYSSIMGQYRKDIDAVNEAQQKRAKIEEEATKVQDKDIISLQKFIKTVDAYKGSIEKDNKTDMPAYANVTNIRGSANDLLNRLRKDTSGDKDQVAID